MPHAVSELENLVFDGSASLQTAGLPECLAAGSKCYQVMEGEVVSNKNLVMHVGLPKCGSKTLQEFLAVNRRRLAEQGVFYPPNSGQRGHVELMQALRDFDGNANADLSLWHQLREQFEASAQQILLVSHESFLANPQQSNLSKIESIFAGYRIDYVIYYRRFDRWIESFFREHVINKTRYTKSFAEYINEPYIRNHSLKLRLQALAHVPSSRRHLLPIEKCRTAGDMFGPISRLCNLSASAVSSLELVESRNLSLSWANFLLVYAANISELSDELRGELIRNIRANEQNTSESQVQKALHLMAPAHRAKWITHYRRECSELGIECAATPEDLRNLPEPPSFDGDSHMLEDALEPVLGQCNLSQADREVLTDSILAQKAALVSRFAAPARKRFFGLRRAS